MLVREMSNEECFRVFAGARLARLACAVDNQPYVVPVYLAFTNRLTTGRVFTDLPRSVKRSNGCELIR